MDISKIFIGSRHREFQAFRQELKKLVDRTGVFKAVLFPESGVSGQPSRQYLADLKRCQILVLLIGKDTSRHVDAEIHAALDAGIAIIPLLKTDRANSPLPKAWHYYEKDLSGIEYQTFFDQDSLAKAFNDAIIHQTWLAYSPLEDVLGHKSSRDKCYDQLTDLIETASRRLVLIQRTSSLMLGAREYANTEAQFIEVIIKRLRQKPALQFIHVFHGPNTEEEARANPGRGDKVRSKLAPLLKGRKQSGCFTTKLEVTPLLVADYSVGIGLTIKEQLLGVLRRQGGIASRFIKATNELLASGEAPRVSPDQWRPS